MKRNLLVVFWWLLALGCVLFGAYQFLEPAVFFTSQNDTYKRAGGYRDYKFRTHYHRDMNCPLLKYEEPDPHEIFRAKREDDGSFRQIGGTPNVLRVKCPLCSKAKD